jgi:molybdopterin-synthase adenylyltransferase
MVILPKVKTEHAACRLSGGRIRLGGLTYGTAAELTDPDGSVWTLLEGMDGTRTLDEIVARVLARHPDLPADDVRAAAEKIIMSGYVEDAGAPVPAELTDRDRRRYDRNRGYFRWMDLRPRRSSWEPQVALLRSSVTVVGLGGTGGQAALALAASGVGRLHCVDPDIVALSNLNRQLLYSESDLGRPKASAAVEALRRLNGDIEVSGAALRVTGVEDLMTLVADCDVLLLAADTPDGIKSWANRVCLATGTPWVAGGYEGPVVGASSFVPGQSPCWECMRLAEDERRLAQGEVREDIAGRAEVNAVGAPSAGISGYLAAHAVLGLLTGVAPLRPGRFHGVNLLRLGEPFVVDGERRPDCPACAQVA